MDAISMPYSKEAEQTILGAILINPDCFGTAVEYLKPESFYIEQHRELFAIISKMANSGEHVDSITLLNQAVMAHIFETHEEGSHYLHNLVDSVPSVASVESYCKIVADKYYMRSLAEIAQKILTDIQGGETKAQELLDNAEQQIFSIRQGRDISGLTPLHEIMTETYVQIGNLSGEDREKYLGMNSGYKRLDTLISGLNKSDLILVAARPAMGKTAFALNVALHVAKTHIEKKVCIFSLEMPKVQLASRLLSIEAKIDSNKLRNGHLNGDDWTKLANGTADLSNVPIYIDDTANLTVPQIKAKLRRVQNLGLVVIDYLGLIQSTLHTENRVQIVAEITRQLKIMAKQLDVPVILLSQLSRGPESRTDKRPMLADLRDSGSIEQDADIVLFLYRDAYYNKESETPNVAECIVAKNRHGECGTAYLIWDGQYTRFSDMENEHEPV